MKGIILAAGDGGRLRPLTLNTPKVLLESGGRPLIHYVLESYEQAGVSDIAIIVGYLADQVIESLKVTHPQLSFIVNESYDGGNALSVYAAREFVSDEPFFVCMGDHTICPEIAARLLDDRHECSVLCVDTTAQHPSQIGDATRVMVDNDGYIDLIGKNLENWNAIDTGMFKMTPDVFGVIEHLMTTMGDDVGISDVVRYMGGLGNPFATCDVSGEFWADVDTLDDYKSVDILLREQYGERV